MRPVMVRSDLLRDSALPPSAKLVWMGFLMLGKRWGQLSPAVLTKELGLSRHTVNRALRWLEQKPWLQQMEQPPHFPRQKPFSHVPVPAQLIRDIRLTATARVLYAQLHLTQDFESMSGQFSYVELHEAFGIDPRTARSAQSRLVETGWLRTTQRTQLQPVYFQLCNPFSEYVASELDAAKRRLRKSTFRGEALMRELLSLLVDSTEFADGARPGFLVHPETRERLELDRYYPPHIAFEFNGPQHYGTTDWYPDESSFIRQQVRDLVKIGLCVRNNVNLIIVHPEDLSMETLRRKVGDHLPQRELLGLEPIVTHIESKAKRYRVWAAAQSLPKRPVPYNPS